MIDASIDQDFAALERQESLKEVRPSETAAADAAPRIYRGKLASLSSHRECQTGTLHSTTTTPDCDSPRPDPLGHLQTARLGFAAAVILVIYWLWIRRKRK